MKEYKCEENKVEKNVVISYDSKYMIIEFDDKYIISIDPYTKTYNVGYIGEN